MVMKLVSAIITTHNRRDLLGRAIESVFSQTYPNMELIVVDDASDDGTSELCQGDSRINYIYIPKSESRGGNYARNLGVRASKGVYVAFLDDDDYWLPTKIEKQVELIERMNNELVYCGRRKEYVQIDGIEFKDLIPNPRNSGDLRKKILQTICTTTSCILVKRQALIEVGLFDEKLRFWQEYELSIRLAQRKPFYFVNEPLVVYRIDTRDNGRLTNKYYPWKQAVRYIRHKHANLYRQLNIVEKLKMHNLIWRDAAMRCEASRLRFHYAYYKALCLPLRILRKLKK